MRGLALLCGIAICASSAAATLDSGSTSEEGLSDEFLEESLGELSRRFFSEDPPPFEYFLDWVKAATPRQLEALSHVDPNYGIDGPMVLASFSIAVDAKSDAGLLPVLSAVIERLPEQRASAWRAARANIYLRQGQVDLALEDARAARGGGVDLCGDPCDELVESWLETGQAPPRGDLSFAKTPGNYDPRGGVCVDLRPFDAQAWEIQPQILTTALYGTQTTLTMDLRRWWQQALQGCGQSYSDYLLSERLDEAFPASFVQRSYADALDALRQNALPSQLKFLDSELPLPRTECDFAADPNCQKLQPLSMDTARLLVQQLRVLSDSLSPSGYCPKRSDDPVAEANEKRLQAAFEQRLKTLSEQGAAQGLSALAELWADPQFADLGYHRSSYEVHYLLAYWSIQPTDAAAALQLWQSELARMDPGQASSPSNQSLLAKLLLRNRQPRKALDALQFANLQRGDADLGRKLVQLRAALAGGAPLAASRDAETDDWVVAIEQRTSPTSVQPAMLGGHQIDSDIQAADIAYAIEGMDAAIYAELAQTWTSILEEGVPAGGSFLSELYQRDDLARQWDKRIRRAIAEADLLSGTITVGELQLSLPKQVCFDDECSEMAELDAANLILVLQAAGLLIDEGASQTDDGLAQSGKVP